MVVATSRRNANNLKKDYEYNLNNYNWPNTSWITHEKIKTKINSSNYFGGFFDPNGGHFHPIKYLYGLTKVAKNMGVKVFENSEVLSITKGETNTLMTKDAVIKAPYVVVAANIYIKDLFKELTKRIMPVGAWMDATKKLTSETVSKLNPSKAALYDSNHVMDYFRFTSDNRLLFGGGVSYSPILPRDLRKSLSSHIARVFPSLIDVELEFAWGGHVDVTLHSNPDFGRIGNNIYYLQGFSGHGVALTNIMGKLVAQSIASQNNRFDVFT